MAQKYLGYDDATGNQTTMPTPGAPTDQDYDVGGGGQVNFTVTKTFDSGSVIDVYVDGWLKREGSGKDFTRNTSLNRIEFTYTVVQNAWVRIRVY